MEVVIYKTCTRCKEVKSIDLFYNNKRSKDNKTSWCKVCSNYQSNVVQKESKSLWAARTHQNYKSKKPSYYLWRMAKRRAKDYNREFTIAPEDIIIPDVCPYTGVTLSFTNERHSVPSLDRIDNDRGYTPDNIQVISFGANRLKSDFPMEFIIKFAKGILAAHARNGGVDNVNQG